VASTWWSSDPASAMRGMGFLGMIKTCVGACGLMSRNAEDEIVFKDNVAGISRAMISRTSFAHNNQKPRNTRTHENSFHDQRATGLFRLGGEALAQVFDDLVLQIFAAGAPPLRAGQMLDAAAQSAKTHKLRRLTQLAAQGVAQAREEKQLPSVARFMRERRRSPAVGSASEPGGFPSARAVIPKPRNTFSSTPANSARKWFAARGRV